MEMVRESCEQRLDEALNSEVDMVHQVARYMAKVRGKRLRPALTVLCARACGRWDDQVIDAGVGVEMIHAATMIHDDVVDSAATRRGMATINARWDDRVAVLMGDFLLARALTIFTRIGNVEALDTVARATERLSQGEIFEIQIGQQTDTREASYLGMVSDKTASLITASCRIGPLLVGAPANVVEAMSQYGESLGLAFQIVDDMLDFVGDATTLGKPVGHDLEEGKITLPLIRALSAAPDDRRQEMEGVLAKEDKGEADWSAIVEFVNAFDGVEGARRTARDYAQKAEACLDALEPSPSRAVLQQAVRLVVERQR